MQGAVQVAEGIWVYHMTEKGLALELTVKSAKFHEDNKLNKIEKSGKDENSNKDGKKDE